MLRKLLLRCGEIRQHLYIKYICLGIFITSIYIIYYSSPRIGYTLVKIILPNVRSPLHYMQEYRFLYHPGSRWYTEIQEIQLFSSESVDETGKIQSNFHNYGYQPTTKRTTTINKSLYFSEMLFQTVSFPVLWVDFVGDVHWNEAAELEMQTYLTEKQFPPLQKPLISRNFADSFTHDCQTRQLLILQQWRDGGFLSRLNTLIEQYGQTLYNPVMTVLGLEQFIVKGSAEEDFLQEGIVGYIAPISRCDAYLDSPEMSNIRSDINKIVHKKTLLAKVIAINNFHDLRHRSDASFLHLPAIWKFGYEHIPHRRWLFDLDRRSALDSVTYESSKETLIEHDDEHIYHAPDIRVNLSIWESNNRPFYESNEHLSSNYRITWKDKAFTSFIRYMITLYLHNFPPRIQVLTKLLAVHWTRYLGDKNKLPYNTTLREMGGIFIRRGDKMPEDSFWKKHQHWRNISYYVKGLVDEENKRNKTFSSIFVMTDDASVMSAIMEYASSKSNSSDEKYARQFLYGRQILYNVYAPQSCFNPFIRIGFDQFLVSVNFLVEHASFIVSHNDSNVGRYLERVIYAKRQWKDNRIFRTEDFVKNAPDSLD